MPDPDVTNILVVDDLPEKLLVYRSILEELGQNLVTARSGEEALGLVLRHEFAVILLDVQMPGMDGLETAALIRRRKRSALTPVIFLTAFADEVRIAEGYAHGAVDYILTPVVPEILRAKVRVFVDLYRMTHQVRRQAEERIVLFEERAKRAAAEEATRRAGFLAEVSRALADSLDPDTTARNLAWHAVPFLADLAGVTLAGEAGRPWRTELAWAAAPDPQPQGRQLLALDGPRDRLRDAVERVLACGKTELLHHLDIAFPPSLCEPVPDANVVRSAVVVPLRARGRTLGALTLAHGPSGRRHEPGDVALAEDLASRAAIALDNARLYKEVETADRQKNEFLSMLAHELRNPLAPIRNAAQILKVKVPDQPQVRWAREVIDRQLSHLVRLVDDLLDISRITRGKIRLQSESVDLAVVVAQAVEASRPIIEQSGHRLEVELPEEPVRLTGDPARLAQVLTNLLNNAAKYTENGGHIWLRADRAGDAAVIRVRDTGVGIPPDMLSAIFDLFTQADRSLDRSQGGLGVGLTLVKNLVEMHEGSVSALSEGPGRGSEFVVRLPLRTAPVSREAEPSAGGAALGSASRLSNGSSGFAPLRVLLVDDNVDAVESLSVLLHAAGYQLCSAHDGASAIAAALEFQPDVAVLDIGLPVMNGYDVARRLRAHPQTRGAALVAVTGYGREEDRRLAHEAGFDHHLTKPVEFTVLQQLLGTLRPVTAAGRAGGSAAASAGRR
jgi:signal transduction histidine kinase/DNA-binding response OmpR family regulator